MNVIQMLVLACLLLGGCAAKGTTVVLLEDPDGKVGKVSVTTPAGAQKLDAPRQSTHIEKKESAPSVVTIMEQKAIDRDFGQALSAMPTPPQTFLLYFEQGTTSLTPDSRLQPARILAAIRERVSTDVRVNGHADRVGSNDKNMRLSLERAILVRDYLVGEGVEASIIQAFSHGEGNPLFPTADGVSEPRNRRVEVLVR